MRNEMEYRNCLSTKGNCEHVRKNIHGIYYCNLDGIINVEFFGCVPEYVKKISHTQKEFNIKEK